MENTWRSHLFWVQWSEKEFGGSDIFCPSLKDYIGISQLENDRAGILDRGNA